MLLYFNGDSFSAGVELADDMLPGYPGCFTWPLDYDASAYAKQSKAWLDNSHKPSHPSNKIRMGIVHEMTQTELARSYPNLVHKMTGIPFINKSQGGSSMDRIARVTIADLIKLKKEDPDRKLVAFICTTYIERSEVPNNNPATLDMHGDPTDWASISYTFRQDDHDQVIENIRRYKALFETTYHSLVNFYKNVVLLQDYCKLNDVDLHWVTARENIRSKAEKMYDDRNDLASLIEYADVKPSVIMRDIVDNELSGLPVLCPGGHFSQIVHDKTAEKIVEILKQYVIK